MGDVVVAEGVGEVSWPSASLADASLVVLVAGDDPKMTFEVVVGFAR